MNTYLKQILEYLDREKKRAKCAFEHLQCMESAARVHEIENVSCVVEHLITKMSEKPVFKVELLSKTSKKPEKAHETDAGWDVFADVEIPFNTPSPFIVGTGIKIDIPKGWVVKVHPRSGLATRGYTIANAPGLIDSGYTGEIKVIMNYSAPYTGADVFDMSPIINKGQKIAQLVFEKVEDVELTVVEKIDTMSERGSNGFGSTDKKENK